MSIHSQKCRLKKMESERKEKQKFSVRLVCEIHGGTNAHTHTRIYNVKLHENFVVIVNLFALNSLECNNNCCFFSGSLLWRKSIRITQTSWKLCEYICYIHRCVCNLLLYTNVNAHLGQWCYYKSGKSVDGWVVGSLSHSFIEFNNELLRPSLLSIFYCCCFFLHKSCFD